VVVLMAFGVVVALVALGQLVYRPLGIVQTVVESVQAQRHRGFLTAT